MYIDGYSVMGVVCVLLLRVYQPLEKNYRKDTYAMKENYNENTTT